MAFDSLMKVIQETLASDNQPLQAGAEFATRRSDLATGKSGLILALAEAGSVFGDLEPEVARCSNVFTAELNVSSSELRISNPKPTSAPTKLGDVFDGLASEYWTNLVLNRPTSPVISDTLANDIVRPGLGHGELIRDLVKWASTWPQIESHFVPSETAFDGVGWCNGKSGLLAAYSVAFQVQPSETLRDLMENLAVEVLGYVVREREHEGEYNLCHGWAGALVVVGSVAHLIGSQTLQEQAKLTYQQNATPGSLLGMAPGVILDTTWLTGASGMLWGWLALNKPPIINPLVPHFSRAYGSKESRD